jgi:hypothetical protein
MSFFCVLTLLACAAVLRVHAIVDERPSASVASSNDDTIAQPDGENVVVVTTTTTTTTSVDDEDESKTEKTEKSSSSTTKTSTTPSASSSSSSVWIYRSLLDWQFLLGGVLVLGALAIFRVLRQRNEQLAMAWVANMSAVFDNSFAHFPPSATATTGAYADALLKISDSEFELRATGRQLAKGALLRISLARPFDPSYAFLSLGPRFNTCTINILIDSDRFVKYEFGFVRAAHEADLRARFPALPPTLAAGPRPARLPAEFLPIGDRNSAMLFESLFATDLVHLLQPGRMDGISYFYITDRYPSPDHQVVASLCVAMPDGLDVQRKEAWEAQQIAVMVTINAASRAANGDVARPVNLVRNTAPLGGSAAAAGGGVVDNGFTDGSASTDDESGAASSSSVSASTDSKRLKQQQLELAAQERKEAKLRQQREALAANPAELEKFEHKLAKKKQRRAIKIVRQ